MGIELDIENFDLPQNEGGEETVEEGRLTTNVYKKIKELLVTKKKVPAEEVAFIHDAKTPEQRIKLFSDVTAGRVRILMGSTEKMGTGMNAQERLIAIHHVTHPWRPADMEQRDGRMIRNGNKYPTVFNFVHITRGSFDGYIWQLLENKAGFIDQISRGYVTSREMDDVSENVLSYSEIKALASGNPKVMQKVVLDAERMRLEAIRDSWHNSKRSNEWAIGSLRNKLEAHKSDAGKLGEAIKVRNSNLPKDPKDIKFHISLRPNLDDKQEDLYGDRGKCAS